MDALILQAAEILKSGNLVALPTETVYGLGARADSAEAILKIYEAKGRPSYNPLIVHFHSIAQIQNWLTLPSLAEKLGKKFWPGPLTLIVPSSNKIVKEARAGLDTVAIRIPNHPLALELLKAVDLPLAAPSANRSGHISPTQATHVQQSLGNKVSMVLDGGSCEVGLESTVLDLTSNPPRILRPGRVSKEEIEKEIGPVELFDPLLKKDEALISPGLLEKHYAPESKVFLLSKEEILNWKDKNSGLLTYSFSDIRFSNQINLPDSPKEYAASLYSALYNLENCGQTILIEKPPLSPEWTAILNRLSRMKS